ncbi:MAG: tryptophan--tRNA ligase [Parcubacteria group bacterium]|nr:tryptophan--tRNA ligase [Parcubacteria group bacterium]
MPRLFSGIQPTGALHLGNYLGAVKNWVTLQDQYESIISIVDLHAITIPYDPKTLHERTIGLAIDLIALGIDPKKTKLFTQSHIEEHALLGWLLGTITKLPELNRMTQFKEKAAQHAKSINLGLFAYPVLQAADILLYKAEVVPVGEDQVQHVELTRDIADRFNTVFGTVFPLPKPLLTPTARVMSLDDPTKKMSKSRGEKTCINLADEPEVIQEKLKSAVTDSDPKRAIVFEKSEPAIPNLLRIYQAFTEEKKEVIETHFSGKSYVEFKDEVAEVISLGLSKYRSERAKIASDRTAVERLLKEHAAALRPIAEKTMGEVRMAMGFE